jgi:hypothetical protein
MSEEDDTRALVATNLSKEDAFYHIVDSCDSCKFSEPTVRFWTICRKHSNDYEKVKVHDTGICNEYVTRGY